MANNLEKRFWEIDFLRGLAIIMMILFHLLYDLTYFGEYNLNVHSGFWLYFGRMTATIFILLVGISLTLSFSRAEKKQNAKKKVYQKYLKRGLKVFSWGLIDLLSLGCFILLESRLFWHIHF